MGIVLPESIFGMPKYRYVVEFIHRHAQILAIAAMPEELFQPYTHAKTCLVFLRKRIEGEVPDPDILMADARWCGHDSMGNPSIRTNPDGSTVLMDDLPTITDRFHALYADTELRRVDHLGFRVSPADVVNQILVPRYYDPELKADIEAMANSHELVTIRQLTDSGQLSITTGHEVGKMAYGTGPVPFIRTSDFSNWELKSDPKHAISEYIYQALATKQDSRAGDILLVRDGAVPGSEQHTRPRVHPVRGLHAREVLSTVAAGIRRARCPAGLRRVPPRRRLGPAAPRDRDRAEPPPAVSGAIPLVDGPLELHTPRCGARPAFLPSTPSTNGSRSPAPRSDTCPAMLVQLGRDFRSAREFAEGQRTAVCAALAQQGGVAGGPETKR
jgi:hypothetical protein